MFGYGMGYDYMVGRVFMTLSFVQFHFRISQYVLFLYRKYLHIIFIFYGLYHVFRRFPAFGPQTFVTICHDHFLYRFSTDIQYCIRLRYNCSYIITQ